MAGLTGVEEKLVVTKFHFRLHWFAMISIATLFLCICIALVEVLTRLLLPIPGFQPFPEHLLITPHPTRGYSYVPNLPGLTNSLGFRDDPIRPNEKVHILAVGNSFTVGSGVSSEESWPARLQVLINSTAMLPYPVRVVNAGIAAYNIIQIRILTEELLEELKPNIIILGLYSSRYWRISNPYGFFHGMAIPKDKISKTKVINNGFLYTHFKQPWLKSIDFWLDENFYLGAHILKRLHSSYDNMINYMGKNRNSYSSIEDAQKQLLPLLKEVEKIYRLSIKYDIPLVVMLVNNQEKNGEFKKKEKEYNAVVKLFCKNLEINVFDPLPEFEKLSDGSAKFRLGDDHHWSKLAHMVAAKELSKFLTNIVTVLIDNHN